MRNRGLWSRSPRRRQAKRTSPRRRCSKRTSPRVWRGVISIAGDGNCLFRALTWPDDAQNHARARADVVAHLRRHWSDVYAPFSDAPCDAYCDHMARPGVWGGEMELRAFADVFCVRVHVYGNDGVHIASYGPRDTHDTRRVRYARGHYDRLSP